MTRPEPRAAAGGDVLAGIVSGLREGLGYDLVAVVLFGSRARVIYNLGHGEYVIVAVMRRRRLGGGGGP